MPMYYYNVYKHGVHNSLCATMVLEHCQSQVQHPLYFTMVVEPRDTDACISGFWESAHSGPNLELKLGRSAQVCPTLEFGIGFLSNMVDVPSSLVQH